MKIGSEGERRERQERRLAFTFGDGDARCGGAQQITYGMAQQQASQQKFTRPLRTQEACMAQALFRPQLRCERGQPVVVDAVAVQQPEDGCRRGLR